MDNKNYDWLLVYAQMWRDSNKAADDGPDLPAMARIDGLSGRLLPIGWIASNDGALGAVFVSTWVSACARFRVNFLVVVEFRAKRVFALNHNGNGVFTYGSIEQLAITRINTLCSISRATSQSGRTTIGK
jgi:hypothetical protein